MRKNGFTLIEIFVTLVIVAMFLTAVYAVFLRSVVDTRWIQSSSEAGRLGQSILRLLEHDLSSCVASSEELPHFIGSVSTMDSSTLEFITATDSRSMRDGKASDVIKVAYLTTPNSEADVDNLMKLYRREEYTGGRAPDDNEEFVLLDDKVKVFRVEYYDEAGWRNVWNETAIPRAVRVELVLERTIRPGVSGNMKSSEFTFKSVFMIPVGG